MILFYFCIYTFASPAILFFLKNSPQIGHLELFKNKLSTLIRKDNVIYTVALDRLRGRDTPRAFILVCL